MLSAKTLLWVGSLALFISIVLQFINLATMNSIWIMDSLILGIGGLPFIIRAFYQAEREGKKREQEWQQKIDDPNFEAGRYRRS